MALLFDTQGSSNYYRCVSSVMKYLGELGMVPNLKGSLRLQPHPEGVSTVSQKFAFLSFLFPFLFSFFLRNSVFRITGIQCCNVLENYTRWLWWSDSLNIALFLPDLTWSRKGIFVLHLRLYPTKGSGPVSPNEFVIRPVRLVPQCLAFHKSKLHSHIQMGDK